MCGPIYVCLITGFCRRAESGEIPPIGDQCESAFEDQGKSDQLATGIIHPWKIVFKGTFKSYSVLLSATKTVCLFTITFKLQVRTISTARRIYLVGPVLFRKRKIHSVNLSSGKFIFLQYFSFFPFNHYYI